LGGHTSEVSVAQFSCGSRYIASIDDSICRLWQFDRSLVEKRSKSLMKTNGFEQIEYYSLPHSQGTASQMEKLCVTPVDSPSAKRKAPIKSPFTSPFKSAPNSGRYLNAERSPVKKISKLSSSPLSPLPNICNVELSAKHARSSRRLDFSPENIFAFENESVDDSLASVESPKCAFYYKYPTENLPNWVEERHKTKTEQQRKHPSPPITISVTPKRMCSNIMQFFSPPSPGIANCSRMISHAEREIQRSPRKLLLKQRLKESAERAQKVGRQVTPRRSKATTRRISSTGARGAKSSHRIITDPKTPTSAPPITGQVLTDKILSSSSSPPTTTTTNSAPRVGRTIKDFFMAKRNLNTSS
uniref:WD_REPEATS_REGION domain-containing protein n=1 Tax=Anisakis simplex TaxID=6269 RepID=A0A0M3KF06_ANISI